jgi:aminoglycoside phosphotransferase (APT) family kinase protein
LYESLDRPFAGYKKLPGIAGNISKTVDKHKIARQLGLFLTKLHAYPVDKAREAGVPERSDLVAYWRNKSIEQLNGIDVLNVDPNNLRRYLENDVPLSFEGALRLVHNDLWAEHILVDPRSGSVSGIIDWGDAAISDPAVDFAGLYTWYGEKWLEHVLAYYSSTPDTEIISRSRYLATCLAIHNITLGQDLGRPEWIKAGQEALRRTTDNIS